MLRSGVRPSVRLSASSIDSSNGSAFAAQRRRLQQIFVDSCGRRAAGAGAQQQVRFYGLDNVFLFVLTTVYCCLDAASVSAL